jgi:hypothetical protein
MSLYFALNYRKPTESEPATVWVLNPTALNRLSLRDVSFPGGILDTRSEFIDGYRPGETPRRRGPVAITAMHNTRRIVSQRGTFVLFGADRTPLDQSEYFRRQQAGWTACRINIPPQYVNLIRENLARIGYSATAVFPDLDSVSKELRLLEGFE